MGVETLANALLYVLITIVGAAGITLVIGLAACLWYAFRD